MSKQPDFDTFWRQLMGQRHNLPSTVAFAIDQQGRKFPVRAVDKQLAEFFWNSGWNTGYAEAQADNEVKA